MEQSLVRRSAHPAACGACQALAAERAGQLWCSSPDCRPCACQEARRLCALSAAGCLPMPAHARIFALRTTGERRLLAIGSARPCSLVTPLKQGRHLCNPLKFPLAFRNMHAKATWRKPYMASQIRLTCQEGCRSLLPMVHIKAHISR